MLHLLIFYVLLKLPAAFGATIAIIDTGFDLDHTFLKPKISKFETDEERQNPEMVKEFHGWNFHDNTHLKTPVIADNSVLQEILLYRSLRAKGHREGLSLDEFEWFKKRSSDRDFMKDVKNFKKHSHGTFVAGIALREGENINIFPIRGLNIPSPVVAIEDSSLENAAALKAQTPEEKFKEEIQNSIDRVSKKFSKICHYISLNKIQVVNGSYGITFKNIMTKFREKYKDLTGIEIEETKLKIIVDQYFEELYRRGKKTIQRYPKTLFVFSAGNSALNNDLYQHYPSRIKLPNTITVAAMNGDFLASFSNYGLKHVDVGAPGVAILSLVPKIYSQHGGEMYSPASGTSMAAPYISNLAAQIMNANPRLTPKDVKEIIMTTGNEKNYLKAYIVSGSVVDNRKAIRAALLSKEMKITEAINLAKLDLIPVEDSISMGQSPAISAESFKQKVMEAIPQVISPIDIDDEPNLEDDLTKPEFLLPKNLEIKQQDNSVPPPSTPPSGPVKSSDPIPSSQNEAQSPILFEETSASSSALEPTPLESQSPETLPSSPQ